MKRLLAYLFIVFSLSLTISIHADEQQASQFNWNRSSQMPDYWVTWDFKHLFGMCYNMKNKDLNNYEYCYEVDEQTFLLMKKAAKDVADSIGDNRALFYDRLIPIRKVIYENYKTQIAKAEPSQTQGVGIKCFNPATNKTETWGSYKTCPGNRSIIKTEETIYKATSVGTVATKYNPKQKYFYERSSKISMKKAKEIALSKCKTVSNDCRIYSTQVIRNGVLGEVVLNPQDPSQNDLEEEKKKIAEEKRKIEEEKRKIAEAKKKQEEEDKKRKEVNAKLYVIGSGTGFFVSSEGHVVSNDHVVGICRKVATKIEGKIINFNVINRDEVNDLGLIKGDYKSKNFLSIKSGGAEFGEDIVAFGYPLSDALSTSVKLTRGIVSSLSGPGNNYSEIQIDAAIQPGNSGGPVLNMEGQVVGVASSGLNKLYMLESTEYIPENVNFAVAATTLSNFLKANGVTISNASMNISNTKELAKIGRPATLQLFCMNTKAVYEELKKTKKHSDVLLEKVMELR